MRAISLVGIATLMLTAFYACTGKSAEQARNEEKATQMGEADKYLAEMNYQAALNIYADLKNQHGVFDDLLLKLGKCEKHLGKNEDALRHLTQYLNGNPQSFDGLMDIAEVYIAHNDLPTAIEYYNKVLHYHPNHETARMVKGIVVALQEEVDKG